MIGVIITGILVLSILIYLVIDYYGPEYINLKKDNLFNKECLRAKDLIVQEFDRDGNLWASRGMILYCLKKDDNKFIKIAHVPTGFSFYWLSNFSLLRRYINKPECIEATITGEGHICALSAGFIWHSKLGGRFERAMKLPHYGMSVGRGIFSNGLLADGDSTVYLGEYFRNTDRISVFIYVSEDNGKTWEVAYEFKPGVIRHIHALQKDPYTGKLWFCSGDYDNESMIGWSGDGFRIINIIGKGSQSWRTAQLVFTEEAVYWGGDTGSIDLAGIYRWDKATMQLSRIREIDGAILYGTRLSGGLILFSTDREGFPNENDHKTRLLVVDRNNDVSEIDVGTWKHWEKGLRYSFAMLRTPRNQGNRYLAVSVINQKEIPIGELLLINEENLIP